jgi:hypothetical protein
MILNDYLRIVDSQESLDIQDVNPDPTFGNIDSLAAEDYEERLSNVPAFTADFQKMQKLQSLRYPNGGHSVASEYSFNP